MTLSADNFKKLLALDGSTPEPAIRPGDTGQRIPCLDSCQMITTLIVFSWAPAAHARARSSATNAHLKCSPRLRTHDFAERWYSAVFKLEQLRTFFAFKNIRVEMLISFLKFSLHILEHERVLCTNGCLRLWDVHMLWS